jgi:SAM-dependent methyltransferase
MTFEKEYYETPEFWSDGALTNAGTMVRIRDTIELVPGDARSLLDVGCGNGTFVNTLARARPDLAVTGTDRSRAALVHVSTDKFESDVANIPRPDGAFDCVTCLQVIEHLPCNVYQRALKELARVSNRYLIISVPFKEDLGRDVTRCPECQSQFNVNLHLRSYDSDTMRTLFVPFGFTCVQAINIPPATKWYGQDSYVRLRRYLRERQHPRFQSPICPVCGYRDEQYDPGSSNAASDAAVPKPGLARKLLKAIWPRFKSPGYWVVALYERAPA